MFIQLKGDQASLFRQYLDDFKKKFGTEPRASDRTEAYFCAVSSDAWEMPYWYNN